MESAGPIQALSGSKHTLKLMAFTQELQAGMVPGGCMGEPCPPQAWSLSTHSAALYLFVCWFVGLFI